MISENHFLWFPSFQKYHQDLLKQLIFFLFKLFLINLTPGIFFFQDIHRGFIPFFQYSASPVHILYCKEKQLL